MNDLLRRQKIGSFFRSFCEAPPMSEKMDSIPQSPRYDPHNPTTS